MIMSSRPLSPAMRDAHALITEGQVTYRYRPLSPSTTRPKRVTNRDLAPIYSHDLDGRTVGALILRGLAILLPTTPDHGRVLVTPTEDEES